MVGRDLPAEVGSFLDEMEVLLAAIRDLVEKDDTTKEDDEQRGS